MRLEHLTWLKGYYPARADFLGNPCFGIASWPCSLVAHGEAAKAGELYFLSSCQGLPNPIKEGLDQKLGFGFG